MDSIFLLSTTLYLGLHFYSARVSNLYQRVIVAHNFQALIVTHTGPDKLLTLLQNNDLTPFCDVLPSTMKGGAVI